MDCPICYGPLNEDPEEPEKKRRKTESAAVAEPESNSCCTPCGHIFHRSCMDQWLDSEQARTTHRRCPQCRCRIKKKWLYPVYMNDQVNSSSNTIPLFADDESEIEEGSEDECQNPNCQNLNGRHNVIAKDYEDLQLKHALLQKQNDELTLAVTNLKQENATLKAKVNDMQLGIRAESEDEEDEYDNY